MIGLSLTRFGVFHAATQGVLVGPVGRWLGPRGALGLSMACDGGAHVLLALAGLDGVRDDAGVCAGRHRHANPAIAAVRTGERRKSGRAEGLVTSLTSFVSIFVPLWISLIYCARRATFPGLVWVMAAAMYPACLPFLHKAAAGVPVVAA